jgi:hypothetical protein
VDPAAPKPNLQDDGAAKDTENKKKSTKESDSEGKPPEAG